MLSYKVSSSILANSERHDERFYNRVDMQVSTELQKIEKDQPVLLGSLLASIGTGKGIPKDEQGLGEIAFLKVGNIERYYINYNGSEVVSEEVATRNKMAMLEQGDILISRVGTVGNVCMYNSEQRATPSDNIIVLRLKKDKRIIPFYIVAFLNSSYGQAQIRRLSKQSLQEVINQTSIKALVIPLPHRDVQMAICDQVNTHLKRVRDLQAQAMQEMESAAIVLSGSLGLADGADYRSMSVDQLIALAKKLRALASANGKRFSVEPELDLQREDGDED